MVLILVFVPSIGPTLIGWPYQVKISRWISGVRHRFLWFWSRKPFLALASILSYVTQTLCRPVTKHSQFLLAAKSHKQRLFHRKYIYNKALFNSGAVRMFENFKNSHRDRFDLKSGFVTNYVANVFQNSRSECLTSDNGNVYIEN